MNKKDLHLYTTIGQIHSNIIRAASFEEAVITGLKTILSSGIADYAVIWQIDNEKVQKLHPVFWVCPVDISSLSYSAEEGMPGRVFKTQNREIVSRNSQPERFADEFRDFESIELASIICLPLGSIRSEYGSIQFMRTKEHGDFSDDEADALELFTVLLQSELDSEALYFDKVRNQNVLLSVRNLHKYFMNGDSKTHVLKGINLDVYEGEFLCVLGESGSGKSTILNIIGGLLEGDEGAVTFGAKNLSGLSSKEMTCYRRDNIGFIFQSYNLMPNLTARQNIDLIGELVENPKDSTELLELVGLSGKMDNYPSQLSGGQQQRIAIARAMVKNPRLILADEPTAALDYATSIEVLSVMETVVNTGTSLIVITHNEEIAKMADRVIRIRDGKTYEVLVNRHPLHAADLVW